MTASPETVAVDVGGERPRLLKLAFQLADDVTRDVHERPNFAHLLDLALLRLELRRALGDDAAADPVDAFRAALAALPNEAPAGPWLYRGAAQVGWVAHELERDGLASIGTSGIDARLRTVLETYADTADLDLPRGLLGIGVYALAHPDERTRTALLDAVLDILERRVDRDRDGLHLTTVPLPERIADGSAGCRMVGVAHGAAGLAAFLAAAILAVPQRRERAEPLLSGSVDWIAARRQPRGASVFPHRLELPGPARPTWCSGDPGVSAALRLADEAIGSPSAAALADEAEARVLARPAAGCGVVDSCLCHGAASLAWFGLDLAPRRPEAVRLARDWTSWIADRRGEGRLTYFGPRGMVPDPSFLEGDAGAALVVLEAATGHRGSWRQLLLASPVAHNGKAGR